MNTSIVIALVTVALLFVCVFAGVHISFTLMSLSFVGLFLVTSNLSTALSVLSTTAFNAIRTYTYCVIPLFMLMGTIMQSLVRLATCLSGPTRCWRRSPAAWLPPPLSATLCSRP